MNISLLQNHFLSLFQRTEKPFAVIDGIIYLINSSNTVNEENTLYLKDESFLLEESEEVSVLEKALFHSKAGEFEELISKYVKQTISKVETGFAELEELENFYESVQDMSIENFIKIGVFNAYNNGNKKIIKKSELSVPEIEQMPAIEDLIPQESLLETIINSPGMIVLNNMCYKIGLSSDKNLPYLRYNQHTYKIESWISLEELCKKYTQALTNHLRETIEKYSNGFSKILSQIKKSKNYLKARAKKQKASSKQGYISFQKTKPNQYEIKVIVPPYIIQKDGKYYAFGTAILGLTIVSRANLIRLKNPPRVLNGPYQHPFVYGPNFNYEICYGNLNWTKDRFIWFNRDYDIRTRGLAKKIAEVLREGERTLLKGYIGNNVNPVKNINYFNPIAYSREDAEEYARTHNISLDRIIDN